jgi:hypothetical protein
MSEETFLSAKQLEDIPQDMLPMPVFSDNLRSFFSWGIKSHTHGCYNHFMWMIHPGMVASQNFLYQSESVSEYTKTCRIKLWYCKEWTEEQRHTVIKFIEEQLNRPWYKRIYDVPAILGQLFWRYFQTPGLSICSDYGHAISLVDPEYCLNYPDPEEVNKWLVNHKNYEVYGRYVPD